MKGEGVPIVHAEVGPQTLAWTPPGWVVAEKALPKEDLTYGVRWLRVLDRPGPEFTTLVQMLVPPGTSDRVKTNPMLSMLLKVNCHVDDIARHAQVEQAAASLPALAGSPDASAVEAKATSESDQGS